MEDIESHLPQLIIQCCLSSSATWNMASTYTKYATIRTRTRDGHGDLGRSWFRFCSPESLQNVRLFRSESNGDQNNKAYNKAIIRRVVS
ncbi:hypothetical protein L484_017324 [Morus notabilis]|uniref:Uncharacterized protein n=1 Tax=Morus notabilis TaxID=981085 RepID=W9RP80_9ROSA|nr:hypothetical protein L484_017324 [Morus notabilis]